MERKDYNRRPRYNDSMRYRGAIILAAMLITACSPAPVEPSEAVLHVYRLDPPGFVTVGVDGHLTDEIPFAPPEGCALGVVAPAPQGPLLAIELACPFGPAVVLLDVATGLVEQPIKISDSHLLAWAFGGQGLYLRIDNIHRPRVVLQHLDGEQEELRISEYTYDLAPAPDGHGLVFSFSEGMGLGSEMWEAGLRGAGARAILKDVRNYISLARWSPDGERIAFIKVPDSSTPFTVGELWVMNANGGDARMLAAADAGHGFPTAWAPDGSAIAFVARENAAEASADSLDDALESNLYSVDPHSGSVRRLTAFDGARVEGPIWSPDGAQIAFTAIVDDRMSVFIQSASTYDSRLLKIEGACCAAWLRR